MPAFRALPAAALLAAALLAPFPPDPAEAMSGRRKPPLRRVTGTVRVVGNEPATRVVLTTFREAGVPASDVAVEGPLEPVLRRERQGDTVTVEGRECPAPPGCAGCISAERFASPE